MELHQKVLINTYHRIEVYGLVCMWLARGIVTCEESLEIQGQLEAQRIFETIDGSVCFWRDMENS
jgi:hypothetical protein